MQLTRRSMLAGTASLAALGASAPAFAQTKTKLRFSCAFTPQHHESSSCPGRSPRRLSSSTCFQKAMKVFARCHSTSGAKGSNRS